MPGMLTLATTSLNRFSSLQIMDIAADASSVAVTE